MRSTLCFGGVLNTSATAVPFNADQHPTRPKNELLEHVKSSSGRVLGYALLGGGASKRYAIIPDDLYK